jgi:hypothetical protein
MALASEDEARRCPSCKMTGEELRASRGPSGSTLHHMRCQQKRCRHFESGWIWQSRRDGTIPVREAGEREYPQIPNDHGRAQDYARGLLEGSKRGRHGTMEIPNE